VRPFSDRHYCRRDLPNNQIFLMSRKFERTKKTNQKVVEIPEDPNTMHYLAKQLIRKKPKLMPWFLWKGMLLIVLAPEAKKNEVNA
jgi:hypothetical protein